MENSPRSIIEPAVYAILDKEFGGNKNIEKVNIREKIALKHEAVSLGTRKGSDGASEEESGFKSEVFVKSGVISVKDVVAAMSTPKILGKIDLSGGRSGRSSSSEKKPESPKKPAAASEAAAPSAPAAEAKPAELSQQPVQSTVAVAEQPAPSPRPAQPVTAPVVVQSHTYDERVAADQRNLFRPEEGARLSGPKVLGKIEKSLDFGPSASEMDRLRIVLACYNGGIGHVIDARNLARKYGGDPDSWTDVSHYLTLKSDPAYAEDEIVRHGRFVGRQTLAFVDGVIDRYKTYCSSVGR